MRYVDVILPLPIEGLFTYSITDEMAEKVRLGMRVLVPLGKSKMYTAIAVKVHDDEPTFDVKDVVSILDEHPILLPQQYQLWNWISDYYMSPIGEVYKAALPSLRRRIEETHGDVRQSF